MISNTKISVSFSTFYARKTFLLRGAAPNIKSKKLQESKNRVPVNRKHLTVHKDCDDTMSHRTG